MAWRVIKGILLAVLLVFYVYNVYTARNDLYGAIVLNRVNFVVLLAMLYLAADYAKIFANLFMLVLIGGLLFHGYMYYTVYAASRGDDNVIQTQGQKCRGKGSSWYSKLNGNCY